MLPCLGGIHHPPYHDWGKKIDESSQIIPVGLRLTYGIIWLYRFTNFTQMYLWWALESWQDLEGQHRPTIPEDGSLVRFGDLQDLSYLSMVVVEVPKLEQFWQFITWFELSIYRHMLHVAGSPQKYQEIGWSKDQTRSNPVSFLWCWFIQFNGRLVDPHHRIPQESLAAFHVVNGIWEMWLSFPIVPLRSFKQIYPVNGQFAVILQGNHII